MRSLEDALASAVRTPDEADGRVYGWLLGTVTDLDSKLMRVRARIGKQEDSDSSDWLVPLFGGCIEELPEIGDAVAVIFADGDPHRGAYASFPQSNTQARAIEALALGTSLAGVVNQIIADLKTFVTAYNGQTYSNGGHPAAVSVTFDSCLASDGSVVPAKAGQNKVLSKRGKVR